MPYADQSRYLDRWADPYASYDRERPGWRPDPREVERVTHLVLVDGRLVEVWTEPARGTRWEEHAERFAAERKPPPAPTPDHELLLAWLARLCGTHAELDALTDTVASLVALPTGVVPDEGAAAHLRQVEALLATAAERCFDAETGVALRNGVRVLLGVEAPLVLDRPPEQVAGGVCWAVGKANGLYGSDGVTTHTAVRQALGTRSALDSVGQLVQRALVGWRTGDRGPREAPDLLPLGRVELLTSPTRRRIVALREAARREQAIVVGARPPGTAVTGPSA